MKEITLDPSPMKFTCVVPNVASGTSYVDIAQILSTISRRTYRQGMVYGIKNINIVLPPGNATTFGGVNSVYVSTLPNTWVMAESWKKAFTHWREQQDRSLLEIGDLDTVARSRDFKIFADWQHAEALITYEGENLKPVMVGPGTGASTPSQFVFLTNGGYTTQGDWEYSQMVLPNIHVGGEPVEPYLHAVGNDRDYNMPALTPSRGLIKAYEESRSKPNDPEPNLPAQLTDNLYSNMIESEFGGNEEAIENATEKNDHLPYDVDNYPGGANSAQQLENAFWALNTNNINLREYNTGSLIAPCGLIRIDTYNNDGDLPSNPIIFTFEMCPGSYKGYLAQSMLEMNS